ncbi:MAG: phytanoyl-CoA dioxygenase family protein [Pseudomonadota bacterium]
MVDALTGILGKRYFRYPHNFIHQAGSADQGFHKDSHFPWSVRGGLRSHRPNWAMLLYYPQETTVDMGPTQIIPGSQYWNVDHEGHDVGEDMLDLRFNADKVGTMPDLDERDERIAKTVSAFDAQTPSTPITVPAGTAVLTHFDLVHRGSRKHSEQERFMYKFWYLRTTEPKRTGRTISLSCTDVRREPVVASMAEWLTGNRPSLASRSDQVAEATDEAARIEQAYQRGFDGDATLAEGLLSEDETTRRAAMYGLSVAGDLGAEAAMLATQSNHPGIRKSGAFLLGELALGDSAVIAILGRLVAEDDKRDVRCTALNALGRIARSQLSQNPVFDLSGIIDAMTVGSDMDREPDTQGFVLATSPVRQSTAIALLNIVTAAIDAGAARDAIAPIATILQRMATSDTDRYARGTAVEGLCRLALGSEDSVLPTLIEQLSAQYAHTPPARRMDSPVGQRIARD